MKNRLRITDDDRWQSVGIATLTPTVSLFCRPDHRCFLPSVLSGKTCAAQNVRFSPMPSRHRMPGFASCKRCQPDKDSAQQHRLDKIARACQLLEQESPLTLDELAQQVAMSPYHLHRLFKATTGMTLKAGNNHGARRLRDAPAKGVPVTQAIQRRIPRQQQLQPQPIKH